MQIEFEYEFAASMEACEAAMIDPNYAAFLLSRSDHYSSIEIAFEEDDGVCLHRRTRVTVRPPIDRVGPIKFEPKWYQFVNESTWDRKACRQLLRCIPEAKRLADRVVIRSETALEEAAPARTRSHTQIEVSVRNLSLVFRPFAGLIEDTLAQEIKRALVKEIETLEAWLTEHPRWQEPSAQLES